MENKRKTRLLAISVGAILFLLLASTALAQTEFKIAHGDPAAGDNFGKSVDFSGDLVVVGCYHDDTPLTNSGSAYIFRRDGSSWTQEAKLVSPQGQVYDRFGISVAIDGDIVIVGAENAYGAVKGSGAAYVFRFDGLSWNLDTMLTACDGAAYDRFGFSVSLNGNCAIVGAYGDEAESGSIYVYRFDGTNWSEGDKLRANDAANTDRFSWSCAVYGDAIVSGAFLDVAGGLRTGSAYIFRYDGYSWNQEAKLTTPDAVTYSWFGYSVDIKGDRVVVGAYGNTHTAIQAGSAFIFYWDGKEWTQEAELRADDAANGDWFGYSASIDYDRALIGSVWDDDAGENSGSAYVYKRIGSTWSQETKLVASDGAGGDVAGIAVDNEGQRFVVGAIGANGPGGNGQGAAYVYASSVVGVTELVEDLFADGDLYHGEANALISLLEAAQKKLDYDKTNPAINKLHATIEKVNYFVSEGLLAPDDAQTLIDAINAIISDLESTAAKTFAAQHGHTGNLPTQYALAQNRPNPFNPTTTISFSLPEATHATLEIFNILGQKIATPIDRPMEAGDHNAIWDGKGHSSGIYLYRLTTGEFRQTRKMVFVK